MAAKSQPDVRRPNIVVNPVRGLPLYCEYEGGGNSKMFHVRFVFVQEGHRRLCIFANSSSSPAAPWRHKPPVSCRGERESGPVSAPPKGVSKDCDFSGRENFLRSRFERRRGCLGRHFQGKRKPTVCWEDKVVWQWFLPIDFVRSRGNFKYISLGHPAYRQGTWLWPLNKHISSLLGVR